MSPVCAMIEMQAMIAANQERTDNGLALAYGEDAFREIIDSHTINSNAVITFYH